jgi:hypothetical protein
MDGMTPKPPPKPITDISERGAAIGRIVDRLPPGHYTMSLVKLDCGPMHALITQQDGAKVTVIRDVEIKR